MPSTNGHGTKQAVLYARVSTDEQAKSGTRWRSRLTHHESAQHAKGTRSSKRY